MVRYADTLQGRLAKSLEGKLRVYSFAASGAPLSQYLIWARHAVKEYGAAALIINVVGNDFDESLAMYQTAPGFWYYVPDANQVLHLRLFEFPSILRKLVRASALLRYLLINLKAGDVSTNLKGCWSALPLVLSATRQAIPIVLALRIHWRESTRFSAI